VAKRNRTARRAKKSAKAAGSSRKVTTRKKAVKGATKTARRKTAARAAAARTTKRSKGTPAARSPSAVSAAAKKVRGAVARVVQKVAGSLPWSGDENDPIALLEADHRRFEDLLKQGEKTTERAVTGRTNLLDALTAELNVHELIEEKVLYPALQPHAEARDIVLEGYQEHHVADLLVQELHQLARNNEQWGAKFKVLKESLEHHIEEEESRMFPAARQALTREQLQQLGARMREMKKEAEARG